MNNHRRFCLEICYTCSNKCLSCPAPSDVGVLPFDEIKTFIDKNCDGGSFVIISGGEPATHPDFINILNYVTKIGHGADLLLTNARAFRDKKLAESAVKSGLKSVCVPLHGPDAGVHDCLSGINGSFLETIAGLKNLFQLKQQGHPIGITVKILISSRNISRLKDIISFINDEFSHPDKVIIEAMHLINRAKGNQEKLFLTLTEAAPHISEAVAAGRRYRQNIRLVEIPSCIFPDPESYYDILYDFHVFAEEQTMFGPGRCVTVPFREKDTAKSRRCKECQANAFCAGIWKSYARINGLDELKPIKNLKLPICLRHDNMVDSE